MPGLAQVRRMEAISFRSFPATSTFFDGSWAIRLTAGHPAKRLNSVSPLDPSDHANIDARVEMAQHRFDSFGRRLVFRLSPLAPSELAGVLDGRGWSVFDETIIMIADLETLDFSGAMDQLPLKDVGLWVDAFLELSEDTEENKPGLAEVIAAIEPTTGLFVTRNSNNEPLSALRCVQDNDLVGLFDVVTNVEARHQGHGRAIVSSALKWAIKGGASIGWLQVVADNIAAVKLYESFGFQELYRYNYRAAPINK